MKKIITAISLFFLLHFSISAQTTATWLGGTPGRSQDWNCPTNWKEGRVPDEFSQVIIPADRHAYPVISTMVDDIDALIIEGGSTLTLGAKGQLNIIGESGRFNGMSVIGIIENEGILRYEGVSGFSTALGGQIHGHGTMLDLSTMTASKE